jgi:hypothetical protein
MALRNERTIEINVSICTDDHSQRLAVDTSPGNDISFMNETSFKWMSTSHEGIESVKTRWHDDQCFAFRI